MSYLVYINGLGPNYKGDNIYEFIFSDSLNVFGENWDSKPCNQYPQPPDLKYIKKVGVLKDTEVELELIQDSDFFSMVDAMDDVIALGWEKDEYQPKKRLVFRFGENEDTIKDKIYERDLILQFEKN